MYAKAIAMITTPRANYKIPEEDLCTLLHSRALLYVKLCKASRNTPHLLSDLRPHFSLNLQECAELAQRFVFYCRWPSSSHTIKVAHIASFAETKNDVLECSLNKPSFICAWRKVSFSSKSSNSVGTPC